MESTIKSACSKLAALAIAASAMTAQADTYYWKTGGMFYTDAWTNAVGSAITVANSATYVDHDFVVNSGQDISSVAYADENNTECKFNTKSLQLHGLMWYRGKYLEYCKFRLFGGCELRCCGRKATAYPSYINANSSIYVEPSATRGTPAKITTRYDAGRSQKGTELQYPISGSGALPDVPYPADYSTACMGEDLAFVRRTEGHGYSAHDWTWLMDFCDSLKWYNTRL